MKILITGGCGFVGSNIAIFLQKKLKKTNIYCLDSLVRKGSAYNKNRLEKSNIKNLKMKVVKKLQELHKKVVFIRA